MEFTTLQIGIEKNVARVALNRPEVRNALNAMMIRELTEAIDWLDAREVLEFYFVKRRNAIRRFGLLQ